MTRQTTNEDVIELDLARLFRSLLRNSWVMAVCGALGALAVFLSAFFFITPRYESAVTFYVRNSAQGEVPLSNLSAGDISASRVLVDTYIVILDTQQTLQAVIDSANLDLDCDGLREMIRAEAVDETEVFRVLVAGDDPLQVQAIAGTISEVLPRRIEEILEGATAKVVDPAQVPENPAFPQYGMCALIGFLTGFGISAAALLLRELMDTTIRQETDIRNFWDGAILASVPDMNSKEEQDREVGFDACEAYKQLPAKLQFCFADEPGSRVLGITSALAGEGKSITAINLANTLARFQRRVVLVDCDLRRPVLAGRLPVPQVPGLSAYLSHQCEMEKLLQLCRLKDRESAFHVITAGELPPGPVELLSSKRMQELLQKLRERYDYVILDLPPVGEVSDALAVAGEADGMILVIRRGICTGGGLTTAVAQLQSVDARILGAVYNCSTEKSCYGSKDYSRIYQ